MIFGFWTPHNNISIIKDFNDDWLNHFPAFRIFGDADVRASINALHPEWVKVYDLIRIPTCKSDLAILTLLWRYGGLYIDCHCGVIDPIRIKAYLKLLGEYEMIIINKVKDLAEESLASVKPLNSMLFSRRNSPILLKCLKLAFQRLSDHLEAERFAREHIFYDIYSLSGPGLIRDIVCKRSSYLWDDSVVLRRTLKSKIIVVPETSSPIARYRHLGYRSDSTHWSIRQKSELLFDI